MRNLDLSIHFYSFFLLFYIFHRRRKAQYTASLPLFGANKSNHHHEFKETIEVTCLLQVDDRDENDPIFRSLLF